MTVPMFTGLGALRAVALAVACTGLLILASTATAASTFTRFSTDIEADTASHNCGTAFWTDHTGACTGVGASSRWGTAGPFAGTMHVTWCDRAGLHACFHGAPADIPTQLPHGYDRWMRICRPHGEHECGDWLIGAVTLPRGPFSVRGGRIRGHHVGHDSADERRTRDPGGPLFLQVGHHKVIHHGDGEPDAQGYVIGLSGYLDY